MNNPSTLLVFKRLGETPLAALERARKEHHISNEIPMTYAGRLDPMAEGLLLILVGEECKKKEAYLGLEKEYETEIVFGISTDTYDALGIPILGKAHKIPTIDWNMYIGTFIQEYPPYSSKTVDGKALFSHAREGTLSGIEIPTKEVEIFALQHIASRTLSSEELLMSIEERISKIQGDFRQLEILKRWKQVLTAQDSTTAKLFSSHTLNLCVSSGTYIRSLAHRVGIDMGTGAFALSIIRKKIGEYRLGHNETVY